MTRINHKKSGYWTRIEKKLASLSIMYSPQLLVRLKLDMKNGVSLQKTITGEDAWKLVDYRYGHTNCELCGHVGIVRIFKIRSEETGQTLEIGSECVRNYLDADLVDALCKEFDLEYHKIVNPEQYANELEVLAWASQNGKLVSDVAVLRGYRYGLQHNGNPSAVAQKILAGKVVGKKEKEVINFWKFVKENTNLVAFAYLVGYYEKLGHEIRKSVREDVIKFAQQQREQETVLALPYLAVEFALVRSKALESEKSTVELIIAEKCRKYPYLNYYQMNVYKAVFNRGTNVVNEIDTLFKKLAELSLNGRTLDFVQSIEAYYIRNRNITEKQKAALEKIAA
jgi:hypothetical protein